MDGGGFVLRYLNREAEPPTLTTITRQPHQPNITLETVVEIEDPSLASPHYRAAKAEEVELLSDIHARVVELTERGHSVADIALRQLDEAILTHTTASLDPIGRTLRK